MKDIERFTFVTTIDTKKNIMNILANNSKRRSNCQVEQEKVTLGDELKYENNFKHQIIQLRAISAIDKPTLSIIKDIERGGIKDIERFTFVTTSSTKSYR